MRARPKVLQSNTQTRRQRGSSSKDLGYLAESGRHIHQPEGPLLEDLGGTMSGRSDSSRDEFSGFSARVTEVELRSAQIAQLYSQVYTGMIAAIVAACALAALLWNSVPHERLLLWTAVFLVVQIPRQFLLQRFHRKQPQGAELLPWGNWFLAGSVTTALLFGLSAVVIFPGDSFVHQCVLACFLGGFAASTAVAHAPLKECYVSSVLLTLLPLLGRFLYQGGESGFVLAAVGLAFAAALLGTGNSLHRMIATSIRLRYQRDEVIKDLQKAHAVLETRVTEGASELAKTEQRYERLIKSTDTGFVEIDFSGRVLKANEPYARMAGASRANEIIGRFVFDWTAPDALAENEGAVRLCSAQGNISDFETTYLRPDGSMARILIDATTEDREDGPSIVTLCRDITERKRIETALKESEEMFRLLSEQSLLSVAILQDGVYKYSNQAMSDLCEYSLEEILNWGPEEFLAVVHPEDRSLVMTQARMKQRGDPHQTTRYAFRIITKSGMTKWVEIYSKTIEFRGSPANLLTMLDVTEWKKAEEALLDSEATLRTLLQAAPIGIGEVSADRTLGWTNDLLCKMLDYSPEELAGQSARILYQSDEEFLRVGREKHPEVIRHGTGSVETRFRRKDGSVFPVLLSSSSVVRGDLSQGIVFTAMDVTERKRAEAQIRLNEERLQSLYDIARYKAETLQDLLDFTLDEAVKLVESKIGYIYLYDEEKKLFELNTWSKEVMKECEVAEPQTNYELDKTGFWGEAVRQRKPIVLNDFHAPNDLKKGYPEGHVPLHNFLTIPVFEGDKIVAVVGMANKDSDYDESDVRQLTLLMDSVWRIASAKGSELLQRRAATALEHAAEGVIITDTDGTIQYVNSSLERMTGYSQDELLGNNPRILKSGEQDRAFYEKLWRTIKGDDVWTGRFVNKRKDGNLYTEDATISPVRDAAGTITGFVGMKRDITEHLNLSRQLAHAQKMEAVGTLAGGMAHDFNNILQAILGYSDLILMKRGRGDPDRKKLEVIQQAARDGAELVSRILTFSRKAESKLRPVDLNEEIRKAQRLLRRTIPRMIDITLVLEENLPIIEADPGQMEQILLNLAVNAHHAMPDGGQLLIETSNVSLSDEYLRSHLGAKAGRYVLLSASDTGKGIETDVLERIFEPFFTTKPSGQGTGLGLSMVHGIVSQHGGHIRCHSEPGRGSCFKIYLPVSERELDSDLALTREMPAFGSETILLVDDDDRIRAMGTQMIEMGGYNVLTAKSGEEALDIHSLHKERIALVILDLNMPGMGGQKCLEELLRIDPDIKVLVASGYSSNGHAGEQVSSGARGFVNKPYDSKDILTAIRRVLDLGGL
jgi:two-component system, cell cycle sensor histidine kinase and response regulator CckA